MLKWRSVCVAFTQHHVGSLQSHLQQSLLQCAASDQPPPVHVLLQCDRRCCHVAYTIHEGIKTHACKPVCVGVIAFTDDITKLCLYRALPCCKNASQVISSDPADYNFASLLWHESKCKVHHLFDYHAPLGIKTRKPNFKAEFEILNTVQAVSCDTNTTVTSASEPHCGFYQHDVLVPFLFFSFCSFFHLMSNSRHSFIATNCKRRDYALSELECAEQTRPLRNVSLSKRSQEAKCRLQVTL